MKSMPRLKVARKVLPSYVMALKGNLKELEELKELTEKELTKKKP